MLQRKTIVEKLSKRDYRDFICRMKEKVKKDPSVVEKFEEYDIPLKEIDEIEVRLEPLDVSAKTNDMIITLNERMLDNKDIDPVEYLAHEVIHYLQQKTNNMSGHYETDDYLLKPTETEAFEVQLDYKERNQSREKANEYVEELLDYHDVNGKKRKQIKDKIL